MKFTAKTDKELNEDRLLPENDYDFTITAAEDRESKAGNEMIELTIRVYKPDGNFILINDYLVSNLLYKVSAASKACGIHERYLSGTLDASDFVGKSGRLKLGIQPEQNGYPPKNNVKNYLFDKDVVVSSQAQSSKGATTDDLDDSLPF